MKYPLNPGSQAARDNGCLCPVLDNEFGDAEATAGMWVIVQGCPLHWNKLDRGGKNAEGDNEGEADATDDASSP